MILTGKRYQDVIPAKAGIQKKNDRNTGEVRFPLAPALSRGERE